MLSLCMLRNYVGIKQFRSVCGSKHFRKINYYKSPTPQSNLIPIPTVPFLSHQPHRRRWYSTKVSFKLSDIGEGISEVEVLEWYAKEGSKISQFDPVCEVQSDKATVTITSRYSGVVEKVYHKVGDIAKVGSPLCDIMVDEDSKEEPKDVLLQIQEKKKINFEEPTITITTTKGTQKILAAPAVRYLAKKNSLDLSKITGSGKEGRVTKGDLLQYLKVESTQKLPTSEPVSTPTEVIRPTLATPLPQVDGFEIKEVISLKGFSKAMAQSMNLSLTIPHLGYCDEVYMDNLIKFRDSMKSIATARGIKLSYMPFMIKAASLAIKRYPIINSKINNELTEITILANHNIAIAVATPHGLVVPNIKNVQDLSIFEISERLTQIIDRAQNNKLQSSDLQGSTFTISNIGVIGGTYASPILVQPQVCICALGKVQKVPRFDKKDKVIPVNIMNVSWSADHRVIDGATIANFSNLWKKYLEEPTSMLLDTK